MDDNSTLIMAALLGASAVIGAVIKPVIDAIRGKRGNGLDPEAKTWIRDLWNWHSPDTTGQQSWKGADVKQAVIDNREAQESHFIQIHHSNEKIELAIREQTTTVLKGLEGVVNAIRDKD